MEIINGKRVGSEAIIERMEGVRERERETDWKELKWRQERQGCKVAVGCCLRRRKLHERALRDLICTSPACHSTLPIRRDNKRVSS